MTLRPQDLRLGLRTLLPRLRRFGYALTGSESEGDDLLQEAIVKALDRENQWTPGTRLDSWMFRIMQTTWIDKVRSRGRKQRVHSELKAAPFNTHEDGRRLFHDRLDLMDVHTAMMQLGDTERAALILVSIEGHTYNEAAQVLEVPIGTIMSRVARARSQLVEILKTPSDSSLEETKE